MSTNDKSIFVRPLWVTIFALTAAVAWGWAYPLIKLGFAEFHIRFLLFPIILCGGSQCCQRTLPVCHIYQ